MIVCVPMERCKRNHVIAIVKVKHNINVNFLLLYLYCLASEIRY